MNLVINLINQIIWFPGQMKVCITKITCDLLKWSGRIRFIRRANFEVAVFQTQLEAHWGGSSLNLKVLYTSYIYMCLMNIYIYDVFCPTIVFFPAKAIAAWYMEDKVKIQEYNFQRGFTQVSINYSLKSQQEMLFLSIDHQYGLMTGLSCEVSDPAVCVSI